MTEVVWTDDARITLQSVRKEYADGGSGADVSVWLIRDGVR